MASSAGAVELLPPLNDFVAARLEEFDEIPAERKALLMGLAEYVRGQRDAGVPARIAFICTHNSRRSHMAQLWAAVAAAHFGVDVETYSGGTESTAFNPRAIAALNRSGFKIASRILGGDNPHYIAQFAADGPKLECYSKVYNEQPNPQRDFCAVMTCSHADEACPIVAGAAARVAITYDDPKIADDTADEAAVYDERCAQIAREMLLAFSAAAQPK